MNPAPPAAASAAPALRAQRPYGALRRLTQFASLGVFVLIPLLGIFRIDLASGVLLVCEVPVSLRNFPAIAGLALVLATAPLLMITTIGTLWCGWACPQNLVSEWANQRTRRLLGSRADVNVEGAGLVVAPSKNRIVNWLRLGAELALASLLLGCIPLFYFLPPAQLWSLLSSGDDAQFSRFVGRLYLFCAGLAFVDIALVRYFLCNYACLFRFGTLLFGSRDTVHVHYDATRSADCAKCNYCRVSCVTAINPTAIGRYDRCINCAACIDACGQLHAKASPPASGLLRFIGREAAPDGRPRGALDQVLARLGWHGLLFIGGGALLAYGLSH